MSSDRWTKEEIVKIIDKALLLEEIKSYDEDGYDVNSKCGQAENRYFKYKGNKYPLKYIVCRAFEKANKIFNESKKVTGFNPDTAWHVIKDLLGSSEVEDVNESRAHIIDLYGLTDEELKEVVEKFVDRWKTTDSLSWKDLLPKNKSSYRGFEIKISFGQGSRIQEPRCPWISFLKYNQTTSKGIYPIINFNCEKDKLSTFIGESYENQPELDQNSKDTITQKSIRLTRDISKVDEIIKTLNMNMNIYNENFLLNSSSKANHDKTKDKRGEKSLNIPLNQILYGPPGTGKTYRTINKALEVIFSKEDPEQPFTITRGDGNEKDTTYNRAKEHDDREALTAIFDFYKSKGFIDFVTFHQSYGYEEFVEGIKVLDPDHEENHTGELIYKTMPGVFKRLCERARKRMIIENNYGVSDNATLWKVSLEGARENLTKKYCFKNDVIRIGWDDYGDLRKTDQDLKTAVNYFYNDMKPGDLFVSLYDAKTIDGVGVIVGDYEFNDTLGEYKHQRKVKWLIKDKKIFFHDLNKQHDLVQGTIYKLKHVDHNELLSFISVNSEGFQTQENNNHYVLIIDEINRGNISKVFGELITLIEESKREGAIEAIEAILPYSGDPFGVPSNLHIIGTMNTADRSIALLDTALRRRFDFEEMMPEYEKSGVNKIEIEESGITINIGELLEKINQRIEYLYDRDHTIGHAYFMSLKNMDSGKQFNELQGIFKNKVIPLLQEYFYDDWEKIRLVLADNQMEGNSAYQFIKSNDMLKDVKSLFGSNIDESVDDEQVVYMLNKPAFKEIKSYKKIYSLSQVIE